MRRWPLTLVLVVLSMGAAEPVPLALHSAEPAPRELVRNRADVAMRLYNGLDAAAIDRAETMLARGQWDGAVAAALPVLMERAAEYTEAGSPEKALPLLRQMQTIWGDDTGYLWVEAMACMATGDAGDARLALDEVLMRRPDFVAGYLNRALAAGRLGSIPRMKADLAVAAALDAHAERDFEQAHRAEIDGDISAASKQSVEDVTTQFLQAISSGASDAALLQLAEGVQQAVNLNRRDPQEKNQDGLRIRAAAIEADPGAAPLGEMARYVYLESPSKYGEGNDTAIEWVNDRILAMNFANRALRIDGQNIAALATKAWLLEEDN